MADRDLHPLERSLLEFLEGPGEAWDGEIIASSALPDEGSYRRASQWLLSRGLVEEAGRRVRTVVTLGPAGLESLAAGGTPEMLLLGLVRSGVDSLSRIQEDGRFERGRWGSAFGALSRDGSLVREAGGGISAAAFGDGVWGACWDEVYSVLAGGGEVCLESLSPSVAGLVRERSPKRGSGRAEFILSETASVRLAITDPGRGALAGAGETAATGQLTPAMLADGSWRTARFRRYDMDIPAARIHAGRTHPYRSFLDAVRRKFTSLGFLEMTGSMAESEFWNSDALFMPQFHPARDIHDVYFLSGPEGALEPPGELLERVAAAHENGWRTGSRGWEYPFDPRRAGTAVLRSQGTALSARCLASGPRVPGKYFAIARCFRYDQVDATHLPDFFQVEGIVLGREMNLRHLVGLLRLFASEVAGASEYRLCPSYFPFTEPSVEMHIRHPLIGWMEMGGAGLFRPEVTLPLGVEVPVIAWGLGLDRMAMTAMGLGDIRDLMTNDLGRLRRMQVRPDRMPGGGGGGNAQD